jgi:hypothetical protein
VRVLGKSVEAEIRSQRATLDSITARRVSMPPLGDQRAAERLVVRLTAGGFRGNADADVIFVRVGRAVAAFSLGTVGGPFDRTLEAELVGAVTDRLATGLNGAP